MSENPHFGHIDDGAVHDVVPVAGPLVDGVVNVRGQSHTFERLTRSERWAPATTGRRGAAGAVTAPFPAVVTDVSVSPGQSVDGTDAIVVIEAMKMLHTLTAGGPGIVADVRVAAGDQVETGQILVTFIDDTTDHNEEGSDA